jgi:large subunit ribosomal protein L4e
MTCADLARIINSDQVQGKLREQRSGSSARRSTKKNPLKNRTLMQRLNPFSKAHRALRQKVATERQAARKAKDSARNKKAGRVEKAKRTARFNAINSGLLESFKAAKKFVDEEEAAGKFNIEVEDD